MSRLRRYALGFVVVALLMSAYFVVKEMVCSARLHERVGRMRETLHAISRFREWKGRLPRNSQGRDGRLTTSWRVDLLSMTIGVKHDFDPGSTWNGPSNEFYRNRCHPSYCGESGTPYTQVFSVDPEMIQSLRDSTRTIGGIRPETLLLIDVPLQSTINWMEPGDPSLSRLLSEEFVPSGGNVLVGFVDGEVWSVNSSSGVVLKQFIRGDTNAVGEVVDREKLLSSIGTKVCRASISLPQLADGAEDNE